MGHVNKSHGVRMLKRIHQKKLREIERKISREERQEFIKKVDKQGIEVNDNKKLETSEILRILTEKSCPICGNVVYPPRIYCNVCRPQKRKEQNVSMPVVEDFPETFVFTPDYKHTIREQL